MSSFTYLSKAAVATAAAATTTGAAAVHHIQRLSASASASPGDENPFQSEMKWRLPMLGVVFVVLVIGFFVVVALARCVHGHPNDHQQASFQSAPKRILPLMSIEPTLNFTNGLTLAGGADHPECTICLSEFVEGEDIRILSNCRHGFHLKCIETWLQSSRSISCPTCRTSCVTTSVKNNPPENQQEEQQQQNEVDLEAANPPEIELMVLQQQQQNGVAANLPESEIVVLHEQQQQQSTE